MISFKPSEASVAIANRRLPDTARTFVFERGTIGNTSFVAIPSTAANKAGALVLADFLLSSESQARAQDPRHLGNFTVLDLARLPPADRAPPFAVGDRQGPAAGLGHRQRSLGHRPDRSLFGRSPCRRGGHRYGVERRAAIESALEEAELAGLADRDPATLSA